MTVRLTVLSVMLGIGAVAGTPLPTTAQQTTRSTETKQFEIVSVNGNRVVVKGQAGAQEITVGPDFNMTVDGKVVTVRDLKPGMKGTARITTTSTTTPVHVTEVRNGVVMRKVGNSIIVRRDDNTVQMFSEEDVTKRHARITRGGQPIAIADLNEGDRLSATIVTDAPPKVMTQREVDAAMTGAPADTSTRAASSPASRTSTAPVASAAPAPVTTTADAGATTRRLPKTASALPAIGLFGMVSTALGAFLSLRRRRHFA